MSAILNFLILFVIQYILIIRSHPRPLQHTSPQYGALDAHLTNMPQFLTRSSTFTKKLRSCGVHFAFLCQTPCQVRFRPLPLGLKFCLCFCGLFDHTEHNTRELDESDVNFGTVWVMMLVTAVVPTGDNAYAWNMHRSVLFSFFPLCIRCFLLLAFALFLRGKCTYSSGMQATSTKIC